MIPCLLSGVDCDVGLVSCLLTVWIPERNSSNDILPSLLVSIDVMIWSISSGSSQSHWATSSYINDESE